jgi:hypothetical protein
MLAPPPEEARPPSATVSFQAFSGMYDSADVAVELELQYLPEPSLNSVPPTAVTSGMLEGSATAGPWVPAGEDPCGSQPAAPESPEEATHVMPSAFACCASNRRLAAEADPDETAGSHMP